MDLKKLDVRTAKRYLDKGRVTQEALDKHLADLPDLAEKAEYVDYATQFAEEEAKRQAEQAPPEPPPAPAPAPEPTMSPSFSALPHSAPPATVAPASVAPSAVASVPRARPLVTETPSPEDGSSGS